MARGDPRDLSVTKGGGGGGEGLWEQHGQPAAVQRWGGRVSNGGGRGSTEPPWLDPSPLPQRGSIDGAPKIQPGPKASGPGGHWDAKKLERILESAGRVVSKKPSFALCPVQKKNPLKHPDRPSPPPRFPNLKTRLPTICNNCWRYAVATHPAKAFPKRVFRHDKPLDHA